jgi:3-hydroxymyristoyl/3-hydroxydecanoyl-(acyl carrier protein) dehydratase
MTVVEPIVVEERLHGSTAEIRVRVPHDLEYFKGHFPGVPVVAGVVQVHWAMLFARRYLGLSGEFVGIEVLKFQQIMGPDTEALLTLEYAPATAKLHFSFDSHQGRHSSGRVLLRDQ